jgi:hypothetical protein
MFLFFKVYWTDLGKAALIVEYFTSSAFNLVETLYYMYGEFYLFRIYINLI